MSHHGRMQMARAHHATVGRRRLRPARNVMSMLLAGMVLSLLGLFVTADPVRAHASLIDSSPGASAVLGESPAEVELVFDEGVGVISNSIRVFDAEGVRVDLNDPSSTGTVVRVSLPPALAQGAYLVSWLVVSDDGHPISGSYSFSVGDAAEINPDLAADLVARDSQTIWDLAGWFTRALGYLGALLAAGLAVFYSRAVPTAPADTSARRLLPWIRGGSWVALVAIGLNVVVQGVRLTNGGFDAVANPDAIEVAFGQGGLLSALVTAAGLSVLVMLAGPVGATWWQPGTRSWLVVPAALVGVAGFALAGHTVTSDPRWLVTLTDAVHLGAAAVWFGGLVGVALLLRRPGGEGPSDEDTERRALVVARFSGLAAVSLVVVAVTGLFVGLRLGGASTLLQTGHGRVLLAKVALVAVAAALGGWNRYRLVPAATRSAGTLRKVVIAEVLVLTTVIGLTASLVIMPPGRTATADVSPASSEARAELTLTDPDGRALVTTVTFEPGRPGTNEVIVELRLDDEPFDAVDEVIVRATQAEIGVGPLRAEAARVVSGQWRSSPLDLTVGGRWTVEVFVGTDAGVANGEVDIDL